VPLSPQHPRALTRLKNSRKRADLDGVTSTISMEVQPPPTLTPPAVFTTTFHIPFTGEREILRTIPITPPGSPPGGALKDSEIHVTFIDMTPESATIRSEFNQILYTINQYLQSTSWSTQEGRTHRKRSWVPAAYTGRRRPGCRSAHSEADRCGTADRGETRCNGTSHRGVHLRRDS